MLSECDLINEVGDWVVWQAFHTIARWQQASGHPHVGISINISAAQLADPNFARRVEMALLATGVPAESVEFELTEVTVAQGGLVCGKNLKDLRDAGIRLAIDDFGTGPSSLAFLLAHDIDTLKVDESFVAKMHQPGKTGRLAEALCQMGRQMGIEVVAEGIESAEQAVWMEQVGCHRGQGYFFGIPDENMVIPAVAHKLLAVS